MEQIYKIVVWDSSAQRIHLMEKNLKSAMRKLAIRATIQFNSEEPLLSRFNLLGKTPAVQINKSAMWRRTPGKIISEEEFITLFKQYTC
jgi:hypothetical protein